MKKFLLVLFLSAGATTFASTGEIIVRPSSTIVEIEATMIKVEKRGETKATLKDIECTLVCTAHPTMTVTYTACDIADAVSQAMSICPEGGTIGIE